MDKKTKKRIDTLNLRLQTLRQQLAGAKKQMDDAQELKHIQDQVAAPKRNWQSSRGRDFPPVRRAVSRLALRATLERGKMPTIDPRSAESHPVVENRPWQQSSRGIPGRWLGSFAQ